ncbi:MAG: hypothetical protein HYZ48_02190, partial [Chlamydiales bacterium]|nr:hypothetical protein [Chlamydiales bacterium]
AIGVFGASGALLLSGISFLDKAISISQAGLGIFNGVVTIGKGYTDTKVILAEADITQIESKVFLEKQILEKTVQSLEFCLNALNESRKKTAQFVNMSVHLNQIAAQRI